ncbi:MAG: AAA family ATPase [Phycisphaerales bacterium]
MTNAPVKLEWEQAPDLILTHPALKESGGVICIAGAVGSGKSTLAQRIIGSTNASLISTDDYLPDYSTIPEHVRDEPESSHLDELADHLGQLRRGEAAEIPTWSFHQHRRTGTQIVEPANIIVIEGIHALHPILAAVSTVGVLVEASKKTRWARWEILETTGQRGWGVRKAKAYFDQIADPTFARHRTQYIHRADFLVTNDHGLPKLD